jgi:hypothetical protein
MGHVIFGITHVPIGTDELLLKCPSCETDMWADILVNSKYFHVYWIPVFPTEKELNIICQSCGLKRYGLPFDSNFIRNYHEIKNKFSHPWLSYLGVGLIVFCILISILVGIFK